MKLAWPHAADGRKMGHFFPVPAVDTGRRTWYRCVLHERARGV